MRDGAGLSAHEHMRDERLPNWGRCGRLNPDKPDDERGSSSIYQMGKTISKPTVISYRCGMCMKEQPDPGEHCNLPMLMLEERVTPEPDPAPPNYADADHLDGFIAQLAADHKSVIRRKYYIRSDELRERRLALPNLTETDAAVRALLDLMHANRKVVDLMRKWGWM